MGSREGNMAQDLITRQTASAGLSSYSHYSHRTYSHYSHRTLTILSLLSPKQTLDWRCGPHCAIDEFQHCTRVVTNCNQLHQLSSAAISCNQRAAHEASSRGLGHHSEFRLLIRTKSSHLQRSRRVRSGCDLDAIWVRSECTI